MSRHSAPLRSVASFALLLPALVASAATPASTPAALKPESQANTPYTWKNVQIVAGGFITGIVAHPTEPDLRYLRTDIGGAYRWDRASSRWIPLTDFVSRADSNNIGIESIALDPSDPQRLYLAVGTYTAPWSTNGAFFLSNDRGRTFNTVPAPFKMGGNDNGRHAGERLAVDPNLGSTLYFGSRQNGLWRSADRGNTWSQVTAFPVFGQTGGVGIVFVRFVPTSGKRGSATPVLYIGVSDTGQAGRPSSLYRSTDAGTTWQPVPGQPSGLYPTHGVLSFAKDAAGTEAALYLSYGDAPGPTGVRRGALWQYVLPPASAPNGPGTWTNISPGLPSRPVDAQGGYSDITADPQRPGTLMASTMDDYAPYGDDLYRTTDYGRHWVSLDQQKTVHDVGLSPWITFGHPNTPYTKMGNWVGTLLIDPFHSDHVLYGNGQTVWESSDITASDRGKPPTFRIGGLGIEETAVLKLISPTVGANLVSGVGDIGGFVHTTLTASPAAGMFVAPVFGATTGLDFAQSQPTTIVRVGSTGNAQKGAWSTDSGTTWKAFATLPAGTTKGSGSIAVSADGATFVWAPSDAPVAYSTDHGSTWTASSNAQAKTDVLSDRFNPKKFYLYKAGTFQISTDGGATFSKANTGLPSGGSLAVSYAAEGDLWFAGPGGLLHSTDSGTSFHPVSGLSAAYTLGFGKAAPGASYPAMYVVGTGSGGYGFYRSTDAGATWLQISDPARQYGYIRMMIGDPRIFGRVYFGTNGRGILYGDPAN